MTLLKCFYCLSGHYPISLRVKKAIVPCRYFSIANKQRIWNHSLKKYKKLYPSISTNHYQQFCPSHSISSEPQQTSTRCRAPQPPTFENITIDQSISHADLLTVLRNCSSIAEQMKTLVSTLSLSPEDLQNRVAFCKELESLFCPFFDDFKINLFGSSVNSFGFKGCDIDLTFVSSSLKRTEVHYVDRPDVPLVSEVLSGKVSPQELAELPPREQLLFLHTVLLEFYHESENAPIYINAHVPLVRFHHDKFKLKCDLTFLNKVANENTKLLYFYSKLDERVIPLMMTIRYWAKHTEVIGKGFAFNTYTITLLVIYFLQTRKPAVLPSAETVLNISTGIQLGTTHEDPRDLISKVPRSENTETLEQLLKDFFFFYLYFDFTRVVCPINAASVPRNEFFSNMTSSKFRLNTMCVQDPLDLSHNVAELVEFKSCRKFLIELMEVCRTFQDRNIFEPRQDDWGLETLISRPQDSHFDENFMSFTLPLAKTTAEKVEAHQMSQNVVKVLQDVLLIDCQPISQEYVSRLLKMQDEVNSLRQQAKHKKLQSNIEKLKYYPERMAKATEIHEQLKDKPIKSLVGGFNEFCGEHATIQTLRCETTQNTWTGRGFISLEKCSQDVLEKERQISLEAAKLNKVDATDQKVKSFTFVCECSVPAKDPEVLVVSIRPTHKQSFHPVLGIFLKDYVPKLISNMNKIMS